MQCAVCPLQLFGMNARDIFIEVLDSVTEEEPQIGWKCYYGSYCNDGLQGGG